MRQQEYAADALPSMCYSFPMNLARILAALAEWQAARVELDAAPNLTTLNPDDFDRLAQAEAALVEAVQALNQPLPAPEPHASATRH